MSTALSWTELRSSRSDLAALLHFRRSGLDPTARRRLRIGGLVIVLSPWRPPWGPAYLGGPHPRAHSGSILALFPSMCLGFLLLACISAIASAGGREVIPREQAVAFPVSSMTDHLGALLLAPLNIAWLVQTWALLGAPPTSSARPAWRPTSSRSCSGWSRRPRWPRSSAGARRGYAAGRTASPSSGCSWWCSSAPPSPWWSPAGWRRCWTAAPPASSSTCSSTGGSGHWTTWLVGVALPRRWPASAPSSSARCPRAWALGRPMREELRLESGHHRVRRLPGSDLAMMLRIDRTAIWRSVPLRRGLTVLALMPGAVALAGHLEWRMLTVLPGLVASGAALLFGVNTWCLDGRGALWRDSLPVPSWVAFASRVIVLFEVLLAAAAVTLLLAALRAGGPRSPSSWRWSARRSSWPPRWSPRACGGASPGPSPPTCAAPGPPPAPPVVMAGYSARLAMVTTFTGLIYSGLAELGDVRIAVSVTVVLLACLGAAPVPGGPPLERPGDPVPGRRRGRRLTCACQSGRVSHVGHFESACEMSGLRSGCPRVVDGDVTADKCGRYVI